FSKVGDHWRSVFDRDAVNELKFGKIKGFSETNIFCGNKISVADLAEIRMVTRKRPNGQGSPLRRELLCHFEEEILDAKVQANEAIPLSDEEIALDAASSEGSMSGPGSGGEEVEAEANYGYGVYHDDY
ncbi:hypothetical protein Tco_1115375, partial [Tanacetum coccineum]